jgi:hypothetical protein
MTDDEFVRDGRTLADWLPHLVSDDRDDRFAAAEAIGGMWKGTRAYSSNEASRHPAGQAERFAAAVREAVDAPGFPKAVFVRKLMLYRMALQRDWLARAARMSHNDKAYDRREDELIERALSSDDEADRDRAATRFARLFCASLARDRELSQGAESLRPPGMVSYLVFQSLGDALMAADDVLAEMLADETLGRYAREALVRIGPAGRRFVPMLLSELDGARGQDLGFEGADALAAIGRGDPAVVGELVRRLRSDADAAVKAGAAEVLETLGADVAGREAEVVDLLRALLRDKGAWRSGLLAMASIGRGRADVAREVAALARPREPRWVTHKRGKYEHRVDEVMWERGAAIDALRYLVQFPDEAVPALADAVETFDEYDPDLQRGQSEHERVAASLRAFGPAAAPAVPVLARHVRMADGDWDREVVLALGSIGPAARPALAALEEIRREMATEGPPDAADAADVEPPTPDSDPVGWAIARIRGDADRCFPRG